MQNKGLVPLLLLAALFFGLANPGSAQFGRRVDVRRHLALPSSLDRVKATAAPGKVGTQATGQPQILNPSSALSAALMTSFGRLSSTVDYMADWDGREDNTADRSREIAAFTINDPTVTRVAISEHTVANGFNETVCYYGDSSGKVRVDVDTNGDAKPDKELIIDLNATLNAFGSLQGSNQILVSGLAVNPVADLSAFSNVNGSYNEFTGATGEILYVAYWDTGGGLRLNANNTLVRSGLLAFPISDSVSVAANPPSPISPLNFPVTVGASFGVLFSTFSNIGGIALDDDGSVYLHQADLLQFTGANIVKATSVDSPFATVNPVLPARQDRALATNGFTTISSLNPANGTYPSASGPVNQVTTFTNYSGTSNTFGNIVSLACGPNNVLYAAVARSLNQADDPNTQNTEGLFTNPPALGATPAMIISFADCAGAFDPASGFVGGVSVGPGIVPIGDGFADPADASVTPTPGVNNFRVFVEGNGPDRRAAPGSPSPVFGTATNTLQLDMQIDYTLYSGLTVDEENKVFVISGGTPTGLGVNPSAGRGEILCFPDDCPFDRRADYIDLRGDNLPNPPASGGTIGDGDSDRFDHVWTVAPLDAQTVTPTGISGLAHGFLRYTNRLAPNPIGTGVTLGQTGGQQVLGDDTSTGPILFESFDPGHQAAGGDDQNFPFRGDDAGGAGTPAVPGALNGGFEFTFGGPVGLPGSVWNAFFLNSNGNITFGAGDTDNTPSEGELRTGKPRVAGAWSDLNPGARAASGNNFPIYAIGFANVNHFKIRNINVPTFSEEALGGSSNTFAISLYDDGTGVDENANQPLNPANPIGNNSVAFDLLEGPTDLRYTSQGGSLVGCPPRPSGSGLIRLDYGRMDLRGSNSFPVLAGYSIGNLNAANPPGLCETNLSLSALIADNGAGPLNPFLFAMIPCYIGAGTEPTVFEYFDGAANRTLNTPATSDFDLRAPGNDPALCTPASQPDANRGQVGLYGCASAPPVSPVASGVSMQYVTAPNQEQSPLNALCDVQMSIAGCGFFPNGTTVICPGVGNQRNGLTISTSVKVDVDTNNDNVSDYTAQLTNVNVVSDKLVTATISRINGLATPFPFAIAGGNATFTVTTSFSTGDNNAFGAFNRIATVTTNLGNRAPAITSITPTHGDCKVPQNVQVQGSGFQVPGNVTSVFAVDTTNPNNVINATSVQLLNNSNLTATFSFGVLNTAKTFRVFCTGPGGTSRNLSQLPGGAPQDCPLGNEAGTAITITCDNGTPTAVAKSVTVNSGTASTVAVPAASFDNGSTDPDAETLTFSVTPAGPYPIGTTNVTFKATDPHGAFDTKPTTVTVIDNDPPHITCANVKAVTKKKKIAVTYPPPTLSDNSGGTVNVTFNPPSGTIFKKRKAPYVVTATATDPSNNTTQTTFQVLVASK